MLSIHVYLSLYIYIYMDIYVYMKQNKSTEDRAAVTTRKAQGPTAGPLDRDLLLSLLFVIIISIMMSITVISTSIIIV